MDRTRLAIRHRTSFRIGAGLAVIAAFAALRGSAARQTDVAVWAVGARDENAQGVRPLSGADGVTTVVERGGSRCLTTKTGTNPASLYLYFAVEDRPAAW